MVAGINDEIFYRNSGRSAISYFSAMNVSIKMRTYFEQADGAGLGHTQQYHPGQLSLLLSRCEQDRLSSYSEILMT